MSIFNSKISIFRSNLSIFRSKISIFKSNLSIFRSKKNLGAKVAFLRKTKNLRAKSVFLRAKINTNQYGLWGSDKAFVIVAEMAVAKAIINAVVKADPVEVVKAMVVCCWSITFTVIFKF